MLNVCSFRIVFAIIFEMFVAVFLGVENGIDTFDCVAPTRIARNGALYTENGRINMHNAKYRTDFSPIDPSCTCDTCAHYTRAYLAHLFRADEMLAATLASVHNIHFIVNLVERMRLAILDGTFAELKAATLAKYLGESGSALTSST